MKGKLIKIGLAIAVLCLIIIPVIPKKSSSKLNLTIDKANYIYVGDIKDKKPNGDGKLYTSTETLVYNGKWVSGKKQGSGKLYFDDGTTLKYDGNWNNDMQTGKGKEYYSSTKLKYDGNWDEGKYNGEGKFYFESGNIKYSGTFKNGEKNGKGKEYFDEKDKIKYEGNWILGIFEQENHLYYENILNHGTIAEYGDWVFLNLPPEVGSQGDPILSRKSVDTKESSMITQKQFGCNINLYKNLIYYTDISGKITKANLNGSDTKDLNAIGDFLNVYEDFIYYVSASDQCIYKMDLEGGNNAKISPDPIGKSKTYERSATGFIYINAAWIYFLGSDLQLYRMKMDGSEKTKILAEKVETLNVINDEIYYISSSDTCLYKIKIGAALKTKVKLSNAKLSNFMLRGEWIYMLNSDQNSKTMSRMKIADPKNPVQLANDVATIFFTISDNYVYYQSVKGSALKIDLKSEKFNILQI